jgi:hypothetical protein
MSIRNYRVSNLLIWTCVASYVEFCLLEKLQVESFAFLAWFMHFQQGGEVWAWNGLLDAFRRFSGGFEPFLGSGVHRSDRSWSPVWPVRILVLFTCCTPVWPMVLTSLTGQGWVLQVPYFQVVFCMHSSRGNCIGSGGSSLWFVELWFGGLRSLLEHSFVSDVSSHCPCLSGPRLVFFKWSCSLPLFGIRSFVGVSFYSFLFFYFSIVLLYVGVVNALIKGGLRTMCGSRTGGWSLPCVMNDWQRCVD